MVCTWLVMISQHDRESCCTIKVTWYPLHREVYKPHTLRDTLALQDEKIFKAPLSFTCEVKKATEDLSWLMIRLKVGVISRRFLHPEQTSVSGRSPSRSLLAAVPFPVSSVLPFAISSRFCRFPFDTLLVDNTFLPSCTEEAFSCDGFALNKVSRPGWVSLRSSCGSCYVTWILRVYRSPIVCANPALKHLIPDRGVTHMVIVMAARFAGTHLLRNVLCLLSQKLGTHLFADFTVFAFQVYVGQQVHRSHTHTHTEVDMPVPCCSHCDTPDFQYMGV